ncbi:MAG: low molecular weight phosphotyrosine protein phosphatase [Trueperaceae bacterium]|nr:MAG: low molecular weight phosphotyrosine protein phosphatase [Trueperaceae bacterium]
MKESRISVLFVCEGNICRSPTAEGILRALVVKAGLTDQISIDSAGTSKYHLGAPPDRRAVREAARRGYDLSTLRARQVAPEDCHYFDYIVAMDGANLSYLRRLCPGIDTLYRLLDFTIEMKEQDIPDPYYGGPRDFERVIDLIEQACRVFFEVLKTRLHAS